MFYNARWYDPALGRFAQADSIVPEGVQGYDRYAYVNNNPFTYVDPSGHDSNLSSIWNSYKQGWTNFGTSLSIMRNPNSTLTQKGIAAAYAVPWMSAHVALVAVGIAEIGTAETAITAGEAACVAMDCGGGYELPRNKDGITYPKVIDPRTGEPIPYPQDVEFSPKDQRLPRPYDYRKDYQDEWNSRGLPEPDGGWDEYVIHHIQPLEYGGTNDFENGVPVTKPDHELFNEFWRGMPKTRYK
jgi:hypothetical protein